MRRCFSFRRFNRPCDTAVAERDMLCCATEYTRLHLVCGLKQHLPETHPDKACSQRRQSDLLCRRCLGWRVHCMTVHMTVQAPPLAVFAISGGAASHVAVRIIGVECVHATAISDGCVRCCCVTASLQVHRATSLDW